MTNCFRTTHIWMLALTVIMSTIGCGGTVKVVQDPAPVTITTFSETGGRCDWNSNTNKIAFDKQYEGRWDIFLCNADKSGMHNLTSDMTGQQYGDQKVESWQHRGQPAFHPTGKYLVFQVMNEHASSTIKTPELLSLGVNNDLWFMHADGTHKQKVTNNPAGYSVLHPHFSHDGNRLMWAEKYNDDKDASIFGAWRVKLAEVKINQDGQMELSNIQNIQPYGERWYETHGFSPDDSKLYFSGNLTTDPKANDIYEYKLADKSIKNLTNSPSTWEEMYNINPSDHKQYSFISSRFFNWKNKWGWATLRTELYINDGTTIKQITHFNDDGSGTLTKSHFFIGDHCWSPDGKSLLAILAEVRVGKSTTKLIRIDLP